MADRSQEKKEMVSILIPSIALSAALEQSPALSCCSGPPKIMQGPCWEAQVSRGKDLTHFLTLTG